jgi:hypothetical protein
MNPPADRLLPRLTGGGRGPRLERFQRYFPAPLVATALLLVLLIFLTPVLVPGGQPAAGTIFTQAVLVVDRSTNNSTNFYLRALSTTVRYSEIEVRLATDFNWSGGFPSPPLNWTNASGGSDLVAYQFNSTQNPIAVNISMLYSAAGSRAYYVGIFAFYVGIPVGSSTQSLLAVTTTGGTSLAGGVNAEPLSSLPFAILLADNGGSP